MVTGKTAAEEWDDSSSVVSSADTNVSLPRVHRRIDSRVNHVEPTLNGEQNAPEVSAGNLDNQEHVEDNSPSISAPEYRPPAQKANQILTQGDLYRKSAFCFKCLKWGHHQSICVEPLRAPRPPMRDAVRRYGFLVFLADKEVRDARVRAERQQEDQRHAEDHALEEARVMNDRWKEDESKAAPRLKEDRVRQDEHNRENELTESSPIY